MNTNKPIPSEKGIEKCDRWTERFIFIFALLVCGWFIYKNYNPNTTVGTVTIQTLTKVDTLHDKIPSYIWVEIHDTITDTIFQPEYIVTNSDYYGSVKIPIPKTPYIYIDTLKFDSLGYAVIKDSIAGSIFKRKFDYTILPKILSIEKTTYLPEPISNKIFFGIQYTYPSNYIGINGFLQIKNNNLFQVGYGYINHNPQYSIGYYPLIKSFK